MRTIVRITEAVRETPSTTTLRFSYNGKARPGQFLMVWLPGDDEIPMSISYLRPGEPMGLTIKTMGKTSGNMILLKEGDRIGVRGPYGSTFDLSPKRILIVAGGSGAAVLAPAADEAAQNGARITVALGATTARELLFKERFSSMPGCTVLVSTDDGTEGEKGYVTNMVQQVLDRDTFDAVWSCGPEIMMLKVAKAAQTKGVPFFGSMERVMKCALNICDACALGPYHVCTDGPVFTGETLMGIEDFGRFKRDESGRHVPL